MSYTGADPGFVVGVSILPLSMIFLLDYGAVPTFASFYDLSIGLWGCSDRVVSFYWIMELFGPCCILFCTCISFL